MRNITEKVVGAFNSGRPARSGNTKSTGNELFLHDNLIARRVDGKVEVSNAGWSSNTTKERLNGVSGVSVCQKNFDWFLNGQKWDGSWIAV